MKLSMVTVCYNSEKTLQRTINSILEQAYRPLEYIFIDGASKDNTLDIIKKNIPVLESKGIEVKCISERDSGIYNAMNKGIKLTSGVVVGLLNSDDYYIDGNVLSKVMQRFKESVQVDVVYGNLKICRDKEVLYNISGIIFENVNGFTANDMRFNHPTLFVIKDIYEKYGYFDEKFKVVSDKDFVIRIVRKGIKSVKIDEVLTIQDVGGVSARTRSIGDIANAMREGWMIGKNNDFSLFETLYMLSRSLRYRILAYIKYKSLKIMGKE
ncbi:MAG: glycosyltransferase family 2 protein [Fusobacteria bacterium]|nr:glycosyltransferase family 2 protein [Fusobacteriota bacterium]